MAAFSEISRRDLHVLPGKDIYYKEGYPYNLNDISEVQEISVWNNILNCVLCDFSSAEHISVLIVSGIVSSNSSTIVVYCTMAYLLVARLADMQLIQFVKQK